MSTYEYRHYIDGRKIAILQRQDVSVYDPSIRYYEAFITPGNDDTAGIMLEYSPHLDSPTEETSDIDVSTRKLALAIVDYVKYRAFQDSGNEQKAEFYYGQFKKKLQENHNRFSKPSLIMPPQGVGRL